MQYMVQKQSLDHDFLTLIDIKKTSMIAAITNDKKSVSKVNWNPSNKPPTDNNFKSPKPIASFLYAMVPKNQLQKYHKTD